jgi:hypothetical protein
VESCNQVCAKRKCFDGVILTKLLLDGFSSTLTFNTRKSSSCQIIKTESG